MGLLSGKFTADQYKKKTSSGGAPFGFLIFLILFFIFFCTLTTGKALVCWKKHPFLDRSLHAQRIT